MFEYFKCQIVDIGITFLQETDSSEDTLNESWDSYKGKISFLHGTTSSCGVMIGNLGNKKFLVNKISKDSNGRVLIIEAEIKMETFILLSIFFRSVRKFLKKDC